MSNTLTIFLTHYYSNLQISVSSSGSNCLPVLGMEMLACKQQEHKNVVNVCLKQIRSVRKRNITSEKKEMVADAEYDIKHTEWNCDT